MITLIFRPIRQQINGIVMAAGGSEDTRYWEKVYDSPPPKKSTWILYSLWRISVRVDVRQMRYILEKMTKYVTKMVIYEQSYCLILCD